MALNSFQLFISQVQSAPEVLKLRVLQIVFDILMVHENEFLGKEGPQVTSAAFHLVVFLIRASLGRNDYHVFAVRSGERGV
jgi:hypothetical protein